MLERRASPKEHNMQRFFAHIFLISVTATLVSAAEPAMAGKRAASRWAAESWAAESWAAANSWCLQGQDWGYPGNCQFSSYAQCMATASGTLSYCGINPAYAFARQGRGY
jgi:hypothetical protein